MVSWRMRFSSDIDSISCAFIHVSWEPNRILTSFVRVSLALINFRGPRNDESRLLMRKLIETISSEISWNSREQTKLFFGVARMVETSKVFRLLLIRRNASILSDMAKTSLIRHEKKSATRWLLPMRHLWCSFEFIGFFQWILLSFISFMTLSWACRELTNDDVKANLKLLPIQAISSIAS